MKNIFKLQLERSEGGLAEVGTRVCELTKIHPVLAFPCPRKSGHRFNPQSGQNWKTCPTPAALSSLQRLPS